MDNMISWNWPNWITVILMVALGYLVVSLAAQLMGKATGKSSVMAPTGVAGNGQSTTAKNFAGVYGASEFAMPSSSLSGGAGW
jgi:hypothetical protein